MKHKIEIEIDMSHMANVYDENEKERENFFEEQIYAGIKQWIVENLQDEILNQAILGGLITDFEFEGIPRWTDLSQYGTIKIKVIDDETEKTVCFFQREKIPDDELNEKIEEAKKVLLTFDTEEVIPKKEEEDELIFEDELEEDKDDEEYKFEQNEDSEEEYEEEQSEELY